MDDHAAHRAECWQRFLRVASAVADANYGPARQYVADLEARFGAEVAARARAELWSYAKRLQAERAENEATAWVDLDG